MAKYTISTMVFDTKEEAIAQVQAWHKGGMLKKGTKIIRCTPQYWEPELKLGITRRFENEEAND